MFLSLLLLVVGNTNFFLLAYGAPTMTKLMPKCGILGARDGRIIGGREALEGEIPWIVSIQNGVQHFCGGSIIGEKFIVSAAHCFSHLDENAKLSVVLGAHRITSLDDLGVQNSEIKYERIFVKKVTSHPQFDGGRQYLNDIAVIELEDGIKWSQFIKPICLPSSGENFGRTADKTYSAIASGWGRTWGQKEWRNEDILEDYEDKYKAHSDVLKTLNLTILPNPECDEFYSKSWNRMTLDSTQMCAGAPEKSWDEDTASGDSGGGLNLFQNGRWTIAGVTSFGTPYKAPGIYSRVSSFLEWINKVVEG